MLRVTALLTGAAVSAPFATAFLSGCSRVSTDLSELHFFEPGEFERVAILADAILPRTDSPSATDVNVHFTIDSMLGLVFGENFKTRFRRQWRALEDYLAEHRFTSLDADAQAALLSELDRGIDGEGDARAAFREFKQQTVAYYLSSEEVGKEFLNYLPIPGEYRPCIPLAEVNNKAWAL